VRASTIIGALALGFGAWLVVRRQGGSTSGALESAPATGAALSRPAPPPIRSAIKTAPAADTPPRGSTLTDNTGPSAGALAYADANPLWAATDNASYTAGATLGAIAAAAKAVPAVGTYVAGAVTALNAGLSALAGVLGKSETNVNRDRLINANAHGIHFSSAMPPGDPRPSSGALINSTRGITNE
jgi:hypothetical protein